MVATRAKTTSSEPGSKSSSNSNSNAASSSVKSTRSTKQAAQKRDGMVQGAAALSWLALSTWLLWSGTVNLAGSVNPDKLTGFGLKAEFAFRYLSLGCLWLVINLIAVSVARVRSGAVDPMTQSSTAVDANNNVLRNSIEQFVLTVVTQLSLISYLPGSLVVVLIPMINVNFLIGRIAFWLGYPSRRSFGFAVSSLPTQIAVLFVTYKFFSTQLGLLNWVPW